MTEFQSFMLTFCFSVTSGFLTGLVTYLIRSAIYERRRKKFMKKNSGN